MPMEKQNKLVDLSVDFAVQILNLVKFLKSQHETIISNQIGRAGTSIGANIHEAQYTHGKRYDELHIFLSVRTENWIFAVDCIC